MLDHHLKNICNITSYYGIFTMEIASPKPNHIKHQIQVDDIDLEFSKIFTDYIKKYTTPKFTKIKFNIHKQGIFNHL